MLTRNDAFLWIHLYTVMTNMALSTNIRFSSTVYFSARRPAAGARPAQQVKAGCQSEGHNLRSVTLRAGVPDLVGFCNQQARQSLPGAAVTAYLR